MTDDRKDILERLEKQFARVPPPGELALWVDLREAIGEIKQLREVKSAIAAEIYKALERLDAPPELLSIIGSYGDTLKDEEVLSALKDWNDFGFAAQQIIAE